MSLQLTIINNFSCDVICRCVYSDGDYSEHTEPRIIKNGKSTVFTLDMHNFVILKLLDKNGRELYDEVIISPDYGNDRLIDMCCVIYYPLDYSSSLRNTFMIDNKFTPNNFKPGWMLNNLDMVKCPIEEFKSNSDNLCLICPDYSTSAKVDLLDYRDCQAWNEYREPEQEECNICMYVFYIFIVLVIIFGSIILISFLVKYH